MSQQQVSQKEQKAQHNSARQATKLQTASCVFEHPYLREQRIIGNHGVLRHHGSDIIQAKLTIGSPDDKYEREADRIARRVMRMPGSQTQRQMGEEEAVDREPVAASDVSARSNDLSSGGQTLPNSIRSFFESRYGHDFSRIRIHTDVRAAEIAQNFNAQAFTSGWHIGFAKGYYAPETIQGRCLLAHELIHVLQQAHRTPGSITIPSIRNLASSPKALVQLQRRRRSAMRSVLIRVRRVKQMIRERNQELYALIERNRFNGRYVEVRSATIGQQQHVWELAVQWQFSGLSTGGRTVSLQPTTRGSRVRHRILVEVNPIRFDTPMLARRIPNDQERLESLAAQTLYHELIHALMRIERDLPSDVPRTSMYKGFQRMLEVANSPDLSRQRDRVKQWLAMLVVIAELFSDQTSRTSYINKEYESLINEKYANQQAASAFGRTRGNVELARVYSNEVARSIEKQGTVSDRRNWVNMVSKLEQAVYLLYEAIDGVLVGPPPEIIPAPGSYSSPILDIAGPITTLE